MGIKGKIVFSILLIQSTLCQIDYNELSKIGCIKGRTRSYKIKSTPISKDIVIKLIPNLSKLTNCTGIVLDKYKNDVSKLIKPIKQALDFYSNNTNPLPTNFRFAGVVLAGVALGVATAAQITAGFALYEARQNAQNIARLKESIISTNEAVTKLEQSGREIVSVITGVQDYINTNIVPNLDRINCDVLKLSLELALTKYYTEILTVFGPNLQDPVGQSLTIQAISQSFGGNYDMLLKTLGYTSSDFVDILASHSITGQITYVDLDVPYIVLRVSYPLLIKIDGAMVQETNIISFQKDASEWMAIVPRYVLIRNSYISNIDLTNCLITDNSVICNNDYAYPMEYNLLQCLRGNTSNCLRQLVLSSHVPRFALSEGVIYANCLTTTCQCYTTGQGIYQSPKSSITMISMKTCEVVAIGGTLIRVGNYLGSINYNTTDVEVGNEVLLDPIDMSNQLININHTLNQAADLIKKSNEILSGVNPKLIQSKIIVCVIILAIASIILSLLTAVSSSILLIKLKSLNKQIDRLYDGFLKSHDGRQKPKDRFDEHVYSID